jgi:hypothetical protein
MANVPSATSTRNGTIMASCEGDTDCRLFIQEKRVSMAYFMSVQETTEE